MPFELFHNMSTQYRIGNTLPNTWNGTKSIIYIRICAEVVNGNLEFYQDSRSGTATIGVNGIDSIVDFMNKLMNGTTPALGPLPTPNPDSNIGQGPLDFRVSENCYIVFELDRDSNMWFRPKLDGISTDLDSDLYNLYFELYHCDGRGEYPGVGIIDTKNPATRPDKCRYAYFAAIARDPGAPPDRATGNRTYDSLNLYVRVGYRDPDPVYKLPRFLDFVLDPDIQNPGGPHQFHGHHNGEGEKN